MKMHPFGDLQDVFSDWPEPRVTVGSRWEMRKVNRGADNDFTVTSVAPPLGPGDVAITTYRPSVSYRRTGSNDIPAEMDYAEFLSNFMRYGTVVTDLGKMTVTAKRPSGGVPWWLLAAGAALLLS